MPSKKGRSKVTYPGRIRVNHKYKYPQYNFLFCNANSIDTGKAQGVQNIYINIRNRFLGMLIGTRRG